MKDYEELNLINKEKIVFMGTFVEYNSSTIWHFSLIRKVIYPIMWSDFGINKLCILFGIV